LHPDHPTHFVTGTAAPCTSLFKPVWIDAGVPDTDPEPDGQFDAASLFWRHEQVHRLTLIDYPERIKLYARERDALEADFLSRALEAGGCSQAERAALSSRSFQSADEAEGEWLERLQGEQAKNPSGGARNSLPYALAWSAFNRSSGFAP
jgi:dipeptidase